MRRRDIFWCFIIVLILLIVWPRKKGSDTTSSKYTELTNVPTPTKAEGFVVVVGANPRINPNQTFSPPTNSVAITNQAQLDLLVKQAKARNAVQ